MFKTSPENATNAPKGFKELLCDLVAIHLHGNRPNQLVKNVEISSGHGSFRDSIENCRVGLVNTLL